MNFSFTIPLRATNEANSSVMRGSKFALARERKNARSQVAKRYLVARPAQMEPLVLVTLTRFGPRTLDDDGLRSSLKATRDAVAACLRIDDGSPLIRWTYEQRRGEYAVHVEVRTSRTSEGK